VFRKFVLSQNSVVSGNYCVDDDMEPYLPRQLIAEKIKSASIKSSWFWNSRDGAYHYRSWRNLSIHFGGTDLRTIQDWVIKRLFRNKELLRLIPREDS
jgi:hypothetical protein